MEKEGVKKPDGINMARNWSIEVDESQLRIRQEAFKTCENKRSLPRGPERQAPLAARKPSMRMRCHLLVVLVKGDERTELNSHTAVKVVGCVSGESTVDVHLCFH